MLDEHNNIKLGDFGLSNEMKDGEFLHTACGTTNYAAPEVITGSFYCGTEADIWSLGVLLFALLSGDLPFDEPNLPALLLKIKSAKFVIPHHISPLASDLIKKLIVFNPMKRLAISSIFQHPWLSGLTPHKPIVRIKANEIQMDIFNELLKLPKFEKKMNLDELKQNIISGDSFDLFTVSYEMMLYAKIKNEFSNEQNDNKKVFTLSKCERKNREKIPNDWKYGFMLDLNPEEIMVSLCQILKDINAKWIFISPFNLKTILRHQEKAKRVKIAIKLYTVRIKIGW